MEALGSELWFLCLAQEEIKGQSAAARMDLMSFPIKGHTRVQMKTPDKL